MVDFIVQTSPKISEITETSLYDYCFQVALKIHKKKVKISFQCRNRRMADAIYS